MKHGLKELKKLLKIFEKMTKEEYEKLYNEVNKNK